MVAKVEVQIEFDAKSGDKAEAVRQGLCDAGFFVSHVEHEEELETMGREWFELEAIKYIAEPESGEFKEACEVIGGLTKNQGGRANIWYAGEGVQKLDGRGNTAYDGADFLLRTNRCFV
jgi:hypothetical protein